MATRVIVEKICDLCEGVAVAVGDVATLVITVDKTEYEVDLCQMCLSNTRVLENARKVKKAPKTPQTLVDTVVARGEDAVPKKRYNVQRGAFPCAQCDFVGKSPNALSAHSRKHAT